MQNCGADDSQASQDPGSGARFVCPCTFEKDFLILFDLFDLPAPIRGFKKPLVRNIFGDSFAIFPDTVAVFR